MATTTLWSGLQIKITKYLLYANQGQDTVSIISNAYVQKNKQSSFVWVISHQNQIIWCGVGLVPGHADDMYSG